MKVGETSLLYRYAKLGDPQAHIHDGCTLLMGVLNTTSLLCLLTIGSGVLLTLAGLFSRFLLGMPSPAANLPDIAQMIFSGLVILALTAALGFGAFRLTRKLCRSIEVL